MNQTISFVRQVDRRPFKLRKDRWEFTPSHRWAWVRRLQSKVFGWAVRKNLFCNAYDETVSVEYTRFETDNFLENLAAQREQLFKDFGREPMRVLMGSEDFAKLMSMPDAHYYLKFGVGADRVRHFMGMSVEVIPWMSGILVMP